jgi:hypothetical protein
MHEGAAWIIVLGNARGYRAVQLFRLRPGSRWTRLRGGEGDTVHKWGMLLTLCLAVGCASTRAGGVRTKGAADDGAAQERFETKVVEFAEQLPEALQQETAGRDQLKTSLKRLFPLRGIGGPAPVVTEGPPDPDAPKKAFAQAVTAVCPRLETGNVLTGAATALSLFSVEESETIGDWINWVQGGALTLGAIASAWGVGQTDAGLQRTLGYVAAGGLGVGGILSIVRGLPPWLDHVRQAMLRVEFNRTFSVLVTQYTSSFDTGAGTCKALRDHVATQPPTIAAEWVAKFLQAREYAREATEGLVKLGSASTDILKKNKDAEAESKVPQLPDHIKNALDKISGATAAVREGWAADQVIIDQYVACLQMGQCAK